MYKYLALLEKPLEEKLEQIMTYRRVLTLLNQENQILQDQLKQCRAEKEMAATIENGQ